MKRDCQCLRARHQHGTRRAYDADRCRCFACRVAHANSTRSYRSGGTWTEALTDATGTRRRLRALSAAGVTTGRVADHMGVSSDMVTYLRGSSTPKVTVRLATAVRDVYEVLWDKGCLDADGRRCRTQALARGYLPPLAWDDDQLDDPDAQAQSLTGPSPIDHRPCGTAAAYRRHLRRGERACSACLGAEAQRRIESKRRRAA